MRIKTFQKKLLKSILCACAVFVVILCFTSFYDYLGKRHVQAENGHFAPLQDSLRNFRFLYNRMNETFNKSTDTRRPKAHKWSGYGLLKVHKAASSTTQEIFLRYGWENNLTFVLPPEYNAFYYPNIISLNESLTPHNILPPPSKRSFEILCHHVIYNKQAWANVLPNNSAIIGTVREPFSLFKSSINYFNPPFLQHIKSINPVRTFLQNPIPYLQASTGIRSMFLNNRMAVEFGVDIDIIRRRDFSSFEKYLFEVLNKEFTVVLVAERFDESLVLMRRKLNWKLKDILYLTQNISPDFIKKYNIGEDERELHRHFAIFDYLLYNFFSKKLENEIYNEDRFDEEVSYFKSVRQSLTDYCRHQERWRESNLSIQESDWNEAFIITKHECFLMHVFEIDFTQEIRRRQYGYATWTYPALRQSKNMLNKPHKIDLNKI